MSDSEENPDQPSKNTSSVPLKKETVRVTLKAADAPSATPSSAAPAPAAPKPTAPAPSAPTPTAPKAPTPAPAAPTPTAPSAGPKPPTPAATIPLKTAGGGAPAPAPTIKLNTQGAPGGPGVALKGGPSPAAPGQTAALPKATVQLNPPTQPLQSTPGAASPTFGQMEDDEEEAGTSPVVVGLSIAGFLGAAAILFFQITTVSLWEGWDKLF